MNGFLRLGMPHCTGTVDGTHIMIYSLGGHDAEFINRKLTYSESVLMHGTTENMGRFINMKIGLSSGNHEAHIFQQSPNGCRQFCPQEPQHHDRWHQDTTLHHCRSHVLSASVADEALWQSWQPTPPAFWLLGLWKSWLTRHPIWSSFIGRVQASSARLSWQVAGGS